MTLSQLLAALLDLDEAGYRDETVVLTTATASAASEFRLGLVLDEGSIARIPGISWADAKVVA